MKVHRNAPDLDLCDHRAGTVKPHLLAPVASLPIADSEGLRLAADWHHEMN